MNKKGISPVIATVIIVAVAIAIAIAVAFWMTGIVTIFTGQVENLQIVAAIPDKDTYIIHIIVKNAGTTTVTVDGVFVTPSDISATWGTDTSGSNQGTVNQLVTGVSVDPGDSLDIYVNIGSDDWNSGQSIEIKLHTASGKEYPKLLVLP